ncbi:hypothetical protein ACVW0P_000354 [Mucilaginibacter sp. UYNi724]
MNKQQVDGLTNKRPMYQMPEKLRAPYVYNFNGIILNLYNVNHDSTNISLPAMKHLSDDLAGLLRRHGNNTYTSVIKNIGNNQVLITNRVVDNVGRYEFNLKNKDRTWTFWGNIDYPEADLKKAEALLNDILNNAQFIE